VRKGGFMGDQGPPMQGAFSALQFRPPAGFPTPARACAAQVVDVSTSKTGKHGHAKCHFVALDIFTSRKMEELVLSSTTWRRVARISRSRAGGRPAATAAARAAGASGPAWHAAPHDGGTRRQTAHGRHACHRATRLHRAPRSKPHAAQVPHVSRQDYSLLDILRRRLRAPPA
jgi:hypothetical protein